MQKEEFLTSSPFTVARLINEPEMRVYKQSPYPDIICPYARIENLAVCPFAEVPVILAESAERRHSRRKRCR